jgi:Protein of unknown function (DUF1501)
MAIARRDFLKVGTAGLLGLSLPEFLAAEARAAASTRAKAKAKSVILVWLPGGPSAIDMWDNKPNAPEGIRGEFKSIRTACAGIEFAETLPKTAAVADKLTVVRSLNHTIPSHVPAIKYMTTGNKPAASVAYPSLGSLAAKLLTTPRGVPPYVTFGEQRSNAATAGYLGTGFNPFIVEGNGSGTREKGGPAFKVRGITLPGGFTLDDLRQGDELLREFDTGFQALDAKDSLVEGLDTFHQQALDILRSEKPRAAFDLESEPASVRQMYGNSRAGLSAIAARRLIEAGVRFATITTGGWDTHNKNFETLRLKNVPPLDTILSALIADLDQRGLLDSTIVLCAGEFSRTPKINKNAGRDHWARCMSIVLAGGGFKRGYVHGSTDPLGMAPTSDPVTPDDLSATIFSLLGIDPNSELQTSTGRPVQLFREGKFISKLVV